MYRNLPFRVAPFAVLLLPIALLCAAPAGETKPAAGVIDKGQRVFVCGHSFHNYIAGPLTEVAKAAGIKDHTLVDSQFLGGSRTLQHWNLPDEKNKAKAALKAGKVDVLTLSPTTMPDEGVDHFVKLGLEHNPKLRVTVQVSWTPYDLDLKQLQGGGKGKVDRNKTPQQLNQMHAAYFKSVSDQVEALNKKHGKPVVFTVPAGQALVALRERIHAGKMPGLKAQEELFSDGLGHPTPPLQALVTYCHYAVIYGKSPVSLPVLALLKKANNASWDEKFSRTLQEIAWDAVVNHPQSGVKAK